ncbi:histidine phosphatase family protein [Deinococcus sp.]|uniref:histidine phosphatase family protein n=1 Tax=Deinococcus sp. TaxID=47478 RepID=UPI0025BCD6D8|nr:histidine phosphatase family protein [Deinococcus sp.]
MTLTLHLVRHAPTASNAERRYPLPGEDAPLAPRGEALARALKLPPGAVAFSSPSRRARQTALLAGFPAATPTPALAEVNFGVMAGRTWTELERTYANLPWHWTRALSNPTLEFGPPGGETGKAFHQRVDQWLRELPGDHEIVAFTHAGPLHAALRLTVGTRAAETPPCTVVTLRRTEGEWTLAGLGQPQ